MERYLGLDLGEKRVGVAISDPTMTIARPLKTIQFKNASCLIRELEEIIHKHHISKIIVGLPITLKGKYSQKTDQIVELFKEIKAALSLVSVELYDERLTTVQAHRTMHHLGRRPSKERAKVDQLAAAHLLQNYLDREKGGRKSDES